MAGGDGEFDEFARYRSRDLVLHFHRLQDQYYVSTFYTIPQANGHLHDLPVHRRDNRALRLCTFDASSDSSHRLYGAWPSTMEELYLLGVHASRGKSQATVRSVLFTHLNKARPDNDFALGGLLL